MSVARASIAASIVVLLAAPAGAQNGPASAEVAAPSSAAAAAAEPVEHGWAVQLVRDVGGDYVHFVSKENALWLGLGGAAALAFHPADDNLSEWAQEEHASWTGGDTYGAQKVQLPLAIAVWAVGAAAGSGKVADTGRWLRSTRLR